MKVRATRGEGRGATLGTLGVAVFVLLAARVFAADITNLPAETKPATRTSDLFADMIVAKGKGVEVRRSLLDDVVINTKAIAVAAGQPLPPDIEYQTLQKLIGIQLLLARANDADRTKGSELGQKLAQEITTRARTEDALNRNLRSVGTTKEKLFKQINEEATAQVVVERELNITVTDEETKKFFDDNPSQFEEPEKVTVSHILLATRDGTGGELSSERKEAKRKFALELQKRARAGEDFAKMVKEYSEDRDSRDKGGEYTFARGQMPKMPEFEAASFALKTNEVSEIVTTMFGYHIIKGLQRIPASKDDFTKASPHIKNYLRQRKLLKEGPAFIAKLQKEANVEILDEKLKEMEAADAARKG